MAMSGPIDRQAVDQFVLEHLPAALRLARRLTNDADAAEDVVQEALCRVLTKWSTFRGEASFSTWMLQIVVNVVRDRRRRQREVLRPSAGDVAAESAGPREHAEAVELGDRIRAAIDSLPARQREVALLSFGEGLAASEVAFILATTEGNVHTCIHLARQHIAKAIGFDLARRN
jgi:RNA polymerase sigma-70 factor, ECF subfamily